MPTQAKTEKVQLSFTNWVLGGSLLSVNSTESSPKRASRKGFVIEVDSDGNEVPPKKHKIEKKRDGDVEKKKDSDGKGDKEKERPKHTCKHHKGKEDNCEKDDSDKSKADGSKQDSNNKAAENGGWTEAQDKTIRDMKTANKSWKEIALEVGASKKDVTDRFKALQKEGSGGGNVGNVGDSGGGGGGDESNDGGFGDFSGLFGCDDESGEKAEETGDKNQSQGGGNNSNQNQGKGEKDKDNKQKPQNEGGNHGGGDHSQKGGSPGQNQAEKSKGKLQADHIWDREDCEILEYLEAKYEEHKWLHMQAGFFNWTGRMVIAELIEKKFKDDGAA